MKTIVRIFSLSMTLVLLTIAAVPMVNAQDTPTATLTLTESDLNAALSQSAAGDPIPTESISFNLRDMEIILAATLQRRNGDPVNVEAVIVPSVVDQHLNWTLASLDTVDANGVKSPRDPASGQATGRFVDVWEHAFRQTLANELALMEEEGIGWLRSVSVKSIVVTENNLTITYTPPSTAGSRTEPAPITGVTAVDGTSNTIMIAEAQANDALAAIARRSDRIQSMSVDFTPDGVKVSAQIITPNGQTVSIIAILIGLLVDPGPQGHLTWQLEDILISSVAAGDVNGDAIGQIITNAWSRFVDLQLKASGNEVAVESIELTNTTMIIAILIGL